ncbi:hypothetical protein ACO0LL_27525 [Undibacterium sp. TC4M20W]|uniref:hypothetical protein n=1 Tax=Undibacterium sp. TC4M20W TaxID=3413052 RepID=UPI003BF2B9FD
MTQLLNTDGQHSDTKEMQKTQITSSFFWANAICASVLTLLLGLIGTFFIPVFHDLHAIFPKEQINLSTQLFDDYSLLLWCATLPCLAIWIYWAINISHPYAKRRTSKAFAALATVEIVLIILAVWSMYDPAKQIRQHTVALSGYEKNISTYR